jgi:hypothetical protein
MLTLVSRSRRYLTGDKGATKVVSSNDNVRLLVFATAGFFVIANPKVRTPPKKSERASEALSALASLEGSERKRSERKRSERKRSERNRRERTRGERTRSERKRSERVSAAST